MNDKLLPCLKALDSECFQAHPHFAKRALAYRLLHLLICPDIARLLPKSLADPLIAPGVKVPLEAKFPPGTVLIPGCEFPAGWDPKDEPPECAKSEPLPTLAMQSTGGNPSSFLSPGESGTGQVHPPPGPPPEVAWFYEPFDNLTDHNWVDQSTGSGSATIVSGQLKTSVTAAGHTGKARRVESRSYPTNFIWTIDVKHDDTTGEAEFALFDTLRYFTLGLVPPTTVRIQQSDWSWYNITVSNFVGVQHTYKLDVVGSVVDLYQDNNLLVSGINIAESAGTPGDMALKSYNICTTWFDNSKIVET